MQIATSEELISKKCLPCEGGVAAYTLQESQSQLAAIPQWKLTDDGKWIQRSLRFKNFVQVVDCIHQIAELAESEAHHPDLHLTGYRNLRIDLSTHAIGGLSVNDFILASKIDSLLKQSFETASK